MDCSVRPSAIPKSPSFVSPPSPRSRFAGFTSRWMTPERWAAASAEAACTSTSVASSGAILPSRSTMASADRPATYSMAM